MQVNDTNRNRRDIGWLGLLCLVLQLAIAPYVTIAEGVANLAIVYTGYVALSIGGRTGVLCGFFAGVAYDLTTTGPLGLMAAILTVAAFAMGAEDRNRLSEDSSGAMVMYLIVSLAAVLAYHLAMLASGQASSLVDALVGRALPTYVLTTVAFLPFAYAGARPGAGGSSGVGLGTGRGRGRGRRGGKYDLGGL